jgi:hypothetical protein
VDFVVSQGAPDWAIEAKNGRGDKVSGMTAFRQRYPNPEISHERLEKVKNSTGRDFRVPAKPRFFT